MAEYDMSYGKVESFFATLLDSKTPRARKYHVYGIYLQALETQSQCKIYEDAYPQRPAENYFAHIVSDNMAVMEYVVRGQSLFTPCLLINKLPKTTNNYYRTYDEALLAGLCYKYSGTEEATQWIARMINMPLKEENQKL